MVKLKSLNTEMKLLSKSLEDLTLAQRNHEQHTDKSYAETQERINFMNYRILEIRQLTGPGGLSKAHIARIRKMKRGSIFQDKADNCADLDDDDEDEMLKESENIVKEEVISLMKKKDKSKKDKSPTKTKKRSSSPAKIVKSNSSNNFLNVPINEDVSEASSTKDSGFDEDILSPRKEKTKPIFPKKKPMSMSPTKSEKSKKASLQTNSKKNKQMKSFKGPFQEDSTIKISPSKMSSSSFDSTLLDNELDKSIKNESDYDVDEDNLFDGMLA